VLSGPYRYGYGDDQPVADLNPPVGILTASYTQAQTTGIQA
jgi:hypothetical protein